MSAFLPPWTTHMHVIVAKVHRLLKSFWHLQRWPRMPASVTNVRICFWRARPGRFGAGQYLGRQPEFSRTILRGYWRLPRAPQLVYTASNFSITEKAPPPQPNVSTCAQYVWQCDTCVTMHGGCRVICWQFDRHPKGKKFCKVYKHKSKRPPTDEQCKRFFSNLMTYFF